MSKVYCFQRRNLKKKTNAPACAFCGKSEDNEVLYGKFIVSDDICVHNYCMFFASGLSQHGDENDLLSGFLLPDIKAELQRGKKLNCRYCNKRGATIGCCIAKCQKSFHLPCGIKHGSLHQHFGSFSSYCQNHAPRQKMRLEKGSISCHICCEDISRDNLDKCLYSPCCKNSWFHKICLQKYALSAGLYFFKCPLCNNSKEFVKEMEYYGIFTPEKDASWELEENAYQDLLIKPECDADTCLCPKGRKYCPKKTSGWTILPCSYCGYHARHKNCEKISPSRGYWVCNECRDLENEILKSKVSTEANATKVQESAIENVLVDEKDNDTPLLTVNNLPSSSSLGNSASVNSPVEEEIDIENIGIEKKPVLVERTLPKTEPFCILVPKISDIYFKADVSSCKSKQSENEFENNDYTSKTTNECKSRNSSRKGRNTKNSCSDTGNKKLSLMEETILETASLSLISTAVDSCSKSDNVSESKIFKLNNKKIESKSRNTEKISRNTEYKYKISKKAADSNVKELTTCLETELDIDSAMENSLLEDVPLSTIIAKTKKPCNNLNQNNSISTESKTTSSISDFKMIEVPSCKTEPEQDLFVKKNDTSVQDKTDMNLKDIKNLVSRSVVKRKNEHNKNHTSRKTIKKRKIETSCNSPNHFCIRKYFGQECGKFRI